MMQKLSFNVFKKKKSKTIAPKIPRVDCLSHYCLSLSYFLSQGHTKNVTRHSNASVAREDRLDIQS